MTSARAVWLGVAVVLTSACASTGVAERQEARLAQVESVAGEAVESFHFWNLESWESIDRRHVLVNTRINEAWLLTVDEPCPGLDFTQKVGLSSSNNRVYARFDSVRFDQQRCRIAEIRPVDVKALRALRREAKAPAATS